MTEHDKKMDALLEKLLLGKHGRWTLRAVQAMCHMRDLYGPLTDEAMRTRGKEEAYAIWGHYSLMSGALTRDIQELHPEEDRLWVQVAVGGPADFDPERRRAIYGEMFERAERAHEDRACPTSTTPACR